MKKFLYSVLLFIIFFLMLGVYFSATGGATGGGAPTLMFFAFLFGLYKIWKSKPNKTKGADFPFHSSLDSLT